MLNGGTSHFDFNDDVVITNNLFPREVQGNGYEKTQQNTMRTTDGSVTKNSSMNGLPTSPKRKEYTMTNRVPKCIRGQKLGDLRDEKYELRSVRAAKQSSEKCSKKCLV